jgi:hypothetical protein
MTAAAYVQAAPHWTAAIGTGTAAEGRASTVAPRAADETPTLPAASIRVPWTAFIGTGHVSESVQPRDEMRAVASSSARSVPALAHWGALIGTGHVSDSNHHG